MLKDTLAHRAQAAARLSSVDLARLLDVNASAVEHWRSGRRTPTGPARAVLAMLERWPEETLARLRDLAGDAH